MHFSIPETVDRRDPKGSVYTVRNILIIKYFQGLVEPQFLAEIKEKGCFTYQTSKLEISLICRAVGRSENPGVPVVIRWA